VILNLGLKWYIQVKSLDLTNDSAKNTFSFLIKPKNFLIVKVGIFSLS
jgi:hypothetical protein